MRRSDICLWLKTGVFLSIALSGCRQVNCTCPQSDRYVQETDTQPVIESKALPVSPALFIPPAETVSPISVSPENPEPPGHHGNYLWLEGVLEQGREAGTWSLRYASSDAPDPYGGHLPLLAPRPLVGYHAGQRLRVEGHVVRELLQAAYQVERIEVLPQR